jgi:hypothetical protein
MVAHPMARRTCSALTGAEIPVRGRAGARLLSMTERVMFIQLKAGYNTDEGPAWISSVRFNKTWRPLLGMDEPPPLVRR